MNRILTNREISVPQDWDRRGLPGWCYHSPALLELEKHNLFLNHWQIICHISDIPERGNYVTLDMCGERALVIRGDEGRIHAFHNMCRHRGSRVVSQSRGTCKGSLVCPFHGWVYNLDGSLRGAAQPKSFPELDKAEFGLPPLEHEVWNGFVFVRFRKGPQPSVAELMAPFAAECANYRMETLVPTENEYWNGVSKVNWKSVRDVDNEGYHVALAHPALQDLYGPTYYDEPFVNGVARSFATFNPSGGRLWSVRHYTRLSQPCPPLPDELKTAWVYWGLFPNAVIAVTPESVQFYQEFPLDPGRTQLRGAIYRYPNETRQQRLARYLAFRIDRDTQAEDVQLTMWSNEAMASPTFDGFYLSDLEYGVRTHHDGIRRAVPVANLEEAPGEEEMASLNAAMQLQSGRD
ncbi:MAG: aromatic ring-hydroxylating dioxygenase subunit alpha [Rhizobiaceae bacterium]